jgi:hypothetical protein|tara:strand:- start:724 stop:1626 length:903 start_codon:yes stop_codon:yes gene_type:complete
VSQEGRTVPYDSGIDFVCISHCKPAYTELLVKSIHKYVSDVDYTIYIVNNYIDLEKERKELNEIFGDDDKVVVLDGVNQSATTHVGGDGTFRQGGMEWIGWMDGCHVVAGSKYGEWGYAVGLTAGSRQYICALDNDAIFLTKWGHPVLELAEKYFFISNRWDPGTLFKEAKDHEPQLGMARPMFWLMKRHNMERHNMYPDCSYRDLWGNITLYAQAVNEKFLILQNSYWTERMRKKYGIGKKETESFHVSPKEHVVNIPYGEQAWLVDKPFFFHQTRGAYRGNDKLEEWLREAGKYLEEN